MKTQADQLDLLVQAAQKREGQTRYIAITSGKGGVGKSTLSANLAYILWHMGYRVGIMDADIGLANLDVIFGVRTEKNILHILKGQASLKDILVPIEDGLFLIPGESGEEIFKYSGEFVLDKFMDEIAILDGLDYVIVDTGAGIGEHVQVFLNASDDILVVTVPEPAAITDAYATVKIAAKDRNRIYMVMNMVKNKKEADSIFEKILKVAHSNIGSQLNLKLLGKVDRDANFAKSTKQRQVFVKDNPNSAVTLDIAHIARQLVAAMEHKVLSESNDRVFGRFFKKILEQF